MTQVFTQALLALCALTSVSAYAMPAPPAYYVGGEQWRPVEKAALPKPVAEAMDQINRSGRSGRAGLVSVMIFQRSRPTGLYPWDPQSIETTHLSSLMKFAEQHYAHLGDRLFPARAKKLFLNILEVYNNLTVATPKELSAEFAPTEEDPVRNDKAMAELSKFVQEKFFAKPDQKAVQILISEASFDSSLEREPTLYIGEKYGVALLRKYRKASGPRKQMAATDPVNASGS